VKCRGKYAVRYVVRYAVKYKVKSKSNTQEVMSLAAYAQLLLGFNYYSLDITLLNGR